MTVLSEKEIEARADLVRGRVKDAVASRGWTLAELARRMGLDEDAKGQISKLLNGRLSLGWEWVQRFASALDCDPGWLVSAATVPIVGYVGGGQRVHNFDDAGELDRTEAPPGTDGFQAVIVQGDSMSPRYTPGTILFYKQADHVAEDCIGRTCICQVDDGSTVVKTIRRGSAPGLYRLVSLNMSEMEDIRLRWASRVAWSREP